ncbi:hypothetical protein P7K49_027206 [Saguinus oedipus]|uniref:Uncharacterized protein n=1 Tax=Saguinus oedipus TaxID=9490 RepID=A0ABQ9UGD6_SAGOE|nr:hypothetical protein P7K49_027206 [Saguinus oedipus]
MLPDQGDQQLLYPPAWLHMPAASVSTCNRAGRASEHHHCPCAANICEIGRDGTNESLRSRTPPLPTSRLSLIPNKVVLASSNPTHLESQDNSTCPSYSKLIASETEAQRGSCPWSLKDTAEVVTVPDEQREKSRLIKGCILALQLPPKDSCGICCSLISCPQAPDCLSLSAGAATVTIMLRPE